LNYRIRFSVAGRARFLSHLETVDTFLAALRRAGYDIALSRGLKPRPVISLAVPRAVGVESAAELADVELVGSPAAADVAAALQPQMPAGIGIVDVREVEGKPAASLVRSLRYQVEVEPDLDWQRAADEFQTAESALVTRVIPDKPNRVVDVKSSCAQVAYEPGTLSFELVPSESGNARPEEVVQAVAATVAATPTINRLVCTEIRMRTAAGVHE
jgi:radical SAM-linked protein